MSDIKLDPISGDIDLTNNRATLVTGVESVEQHWRIRMRHFKGEWFLDRRTGMPYYQEVLVHNPNLNAVTYYFRRATRETPGILSVESFALAFDRILRKLQITTAGTLDPDVAVGKFDFVFAEMILPQKGSRS